MHGGICLLMLLAAGLCRAVPQLLLGDNENRLQDRVRRSSLLLWPNGIQRTPDSGAFCGDPGMPKNGKSVYNSMYERSIVTHSCYPGYILVGAKHRICQRTGVWTPYLPKCLLVDCGDPGTPTHGSKWLFNTYLGSTVSYSCSKGYTLAGDSKRTCQVSGLWSGLLPTCVSDGCPNLPFIRNGHVTIQDSRSGSTAKYSCKKGFVLVGMATRICGLDGVWQGKAPTCDKIINCGQLENPEQGSVMLEAMIPGSTAAYTCNSGYVLAGMSTRTCESNGEWSGQAPTCDAIQCKPLPNIADGQVVVSGSRVGSVAVYTCDQGFQLVGWSRRTCLSSGEWSSSEPSCSKISVVKCGSLTTPANGEVSVSGLVVGSIATYTCRTGFLLVGGAKSRVCLSGGVWSGTTPTCQIISCGPLSNPRNGAVFSPSSTFGSSASYSCNAGFELSGSRQRTCEASGLWSSMEPTCTRTSVMMCGGLAAPANGEVSVSGLAIGSVATYSCRTGFLLVGGAKLRVCSVGGVWSSVAPVCKSVDCGPLSDPHKGSVSLTSTVFGSLASYYCDPGFELVGTTVRTCQANGVWSDAAPTCYRLQTVECGDLRSTPNGRVFLTGTAVGSTATYLCDDGFRLEGDRNRACQETGEWSGKEPTCIRAGCDDLSNPTNGRVTLTGIIPGSVATYSCNEGFSLVGVSIRVCLTNGQWSSSAPRCERIQTGCVLLLSPRNGRVFFSDSGNVGSVATYSCDSGFTLVGRKIRTCLVGGVWSHDEPICKGQQTPCPVLEAPKDGKVHVAGSGPGAIAFYSCQFGYELVGDAQRACLESGRWAGSEPVCQGVDCGDLPPPDHGSITFSEGTTFSSFATYTCTSPFQVVGTVVRVCQASKVWSGTAPICESLRCPPLGDPDNGGVSVSGDIPGSTATYTCLAGFTLVGVQRRNCLNNGFWSADDPQCQRTDCGSLPAPDNGDVDIGGTVMGSQVVYSCEVGFTLDGAETRTCLESGKWSDEDPTCKGVSCGPLPDPDNGKVKLTSVIFKDTATYSCDPGFELVGKNTVRECGSNGQWKGEEPHCRGLNCGPLPHPPNGVVTTTGTRFGSTATYTCDRAFSLVGVAMRICAVSGEWSGVEPKCRANMCPTLAAPAHGHVRQNGNSFGDTAEYSCDPGYTRAGHVTRTCLHDGRWSSIPPQCQPMLCKSLVPPPRGLILFSDGNRFGSEAAYECSEGYNLEGGDNVRKCGINGHWSGIEPFCEIVTCGSIPHPPNGEVKLSGFTFDSIATYTCFDDHVLVGARNRRCLANASWSDSTPVCKFMAFDCGSLTAPENGRVSYHDTISGSLATYSCNVGHFLQGGNNRQRCVEGVGWDGIPPKCQPVDCGILVSPLFGSVATTRGSTFGSVATYSCDIGHALDGMATRMCQESAEWTGFEAPLCIPVDCGTLPRPNNGFTFFTGTTFSFTVTYSCNIGFDLVGVVDRTCEADGKWSGTTPTCERTSGGGGQCGDPGVPSNGRRNGDSFRVGAIVSYECNEGYDLTGSNSRTCLASGRWSAALPTCELADSGAITVECSVEGQEVFDQCGERCTCRHGKLADCCRVRADYASLTTQEKLRYINAVQQLATDPAYQERYNTLVATYTSSSETLAQSTDPDTSQFFVWNRYFLLRYEDLLREIDCKITIPYWDWTALPLNPYMSPVFNPRTGFGDASREGDDCVRNGPFNYTAFNITPSAGGGCLKRQYKLKMFPTRAIIEEDVLSIPATEFTTFHHLLHLFILSNIRCFVGGQMCSPDAANDPVYILHLAQADFIFTRWQLGDARRLNTRFASDTRPLVLASNGAVVSNYANNRDLPRELQVCYREPEFEAHVPVNMIFLSDALLELTNNHELEMECAEDSMVGGSGNQRMGEREKEFMEKMCSG